MGCGESMGGCGWSVWGGARLCHGTGVPGVGLWGVMELPPVPRACPAEMVGPQRFVGSSRVAWNGLALPLSLPWPVRIMFRTRHPRGVLLRAGAGGRLTLILQVSVGEAWAGHGEANRGVFLRKGPGRRGGCHGGVIDLSGDHCHRRYWFGVIGMREVLALEGGRCPGRVLT